MASVTSPQSPGSPGTGLKAVQPTKTYQLPELIDPSLPVEAGDDEDFSDGFGGSSLSEHSSTHSVTSSVRNYVHENGRRYHRYSEGKYWIPNDETEQDRLDILHHIHLMLLGGELHTAPVEHPHRVLDCGTGTGIWALDFGSLHPESEVLGVDLSPIQPDWVYPNVKFELDDLDQDWTWPENHFDFIHSRSIANGIPDYERFVKQTFKHCSPGGYVELVEHQTISCNDGTMGLDTALGKLMDLVINQALPKMNISLPEKNMMMQLMTDAGFEDVTHRPLILPCGGWPKDRRLREIGSNCNLAYQSGIEAYCLAPLTRGLGMDETEAKDLCQAAFQEMLGRKVHAFLTVDYVYGRKPVETS